MIRAVWRGAILAEADEGSVQVVEGNVYFPPDAIDRQFLAESVSHTRCYWKGKASYYDVVVDGDTNADAAWYYPEPSRLAEHLKDHVAFWRGVKVEQS